MAEFNPDEFLRKTSPTQQASSSFDPDEFLNKYKKPVKPDPSELDSAGRGFAQGVSMGLRDEAAGAIESPVGALKEIANKFGARYDDSDVLSYKGERDESRRLDKVAEEENPAAYFAGDMVGSAVSSVAIPMGGQATLAKAVMTGAKQGAAQGFGRSDKESGAELLKETAWGAGAGAAASGLIKSGGDLLPSIKQGAKSLSDSAGDALTNLKNSTITKNAKSVVPTLVDDAAQATATSAEPNLFKEGAKSAQNRLKSFFVSEVDPNFDEYAKIAKKVGINPNELPASVKNGPNSSAARAERSFAEGAYGEETLKRFNENLGKVRNAYDAKISKYANGLPTDEITAGHILRDSYDKGVSKFFNEMDITYNNLIKMSNADDLAMSESAMKAINSSLDGTEKYAKGLLKRGVTATQRGQGQQLLDAVEAIRGANGSFKQTVEAMRYIGDAAYQSKNTMMDVPVDVKQMRKIYNDINDGVISSVRSTYGDQIADQLIENNKLMSEFFGEKSLVAGVLGNKNVSPEQAFKTLILNGDSQKIKALKKVISPEEWNYLKGATLENIVKRNPEGDFTFKQLHNAMRTKRNTLSSMFDAEDLLESADLVRLGDRFGDAVLSRSGTGASLSFGGLVESAVSHVGDPTFKAFAVNRGDAAYKRYLKDQAESIVEKQAPQFRDVTPKTKDAAGAFASQMAAKNINQKSGPDKWASDGQANLIQHDPSFDQSILDKANKSPRLRELLFEASRHKPGTKELNRIAEQIRSAGQVQ